MPSRESSRPAVVVSCHVELPLDDAIWERFVSFQKSRPGGLRIAALLRPPAPEADEREETWLDRVAIARSQGPFGHHTHFGGVHTARPPKPELATERLRREANWLRERDVAPRFWCGGGWYITPAIASVLSDFGYVDCTATAFPLEYLPSGAPHLRLAEPCSLRLKDGRRLLELPATHSLRMAIRLAASLRRIEERPVHVYFHDWELKDRRRAVALRAALTALGQRCRRSDLDQLADEVGGDVPELPLPCGQE
jgi:hypothetical protein